MSQAAPSPEARSRAAARNSPTKRETKKKDAGWERTKRGESARRAEDAGRPLSSRVQDGPENATAVVPGHSRRLQPHIVIRGGDLAMPYATPSRASFPPRPDSYGGLFPPRPARGSVRKGSAPDFLSRECDCRGSPSALTARSSSATIRRLRRNRRDDRPPAAARCKGLRRESGKSPSPENKTTTFGSMVRRGIEREVNGELEDPMRPLGCLRSAPRNRDIPWTRLWSPTRGRRCYPSHVRSAGDGRRIISLISTIAV